jgi:hypothetical protein
MNHTDEPLIETNTEEATDMNKHDTITITRTELRSMIADALRDALREREEKTKETKEHNRRVLAGKGSWIPQRNVVEDDLHDLVLATQVETLRTDMLRKLLDDAADELNRSKYPRLRS